MGLEEKLDAILKNSENLVVLIDSQKDNIQKLEREITGLRAYIGQQKLTTAQLAKKLSRSTSWVKDKVYNNLIFPEQDTPNGKWFFTMQELERIQNEVIKIK